MASTASERALQSRLGAHTKWANTTDRTSATAPGRAAFAARFERQVDPDGTLDPVQRARLAESAKSAYFARLALQSAQSRRRASEARKRAADEETRVRTANAERVAYADAEAEAADAELRQAEQAAAAELRDAEQAAAAPTP